MIRITKRLILQTMILSMFFLIGLIFLFPPERPLSHHTDLEDEVFSWNTPDTSWTINVWKDPLEELPEEISSLLASNEKTREHSVALDESSITDRLTRICTYYEDLCNIVTWEQPHSLQEKYLYQALMIYFIKKVDAALQLPVEQSLRETLRSIKMRKSSSWRRWSAWSNFVKMNTEKIDSFDEFWEVFTHEVWGHIMDLWVITDNYSDQLHPEYTEFGDPKFWLNDWSLKFYKISWIDENTRRADAWFEDFVTWYAMKDIFEEQAEFANAWINHHALLMEMWKKNAKIQQKIDLFENVFWDWYFDDDKESLPEFDPTNRIFDSTKSRIE